MRVYRLLSLTLSLDTQALGRVTFGGCVGGLGNSLYGFLGLPYGDCEGKYISIISVKKNKNHVSISADTQITHGAHLKKNSIGFKLFPHKNIIIGLTGDAQTKTFLKLFCSLTAIKAVDGHYNIL